MDWRCYSNALVDTKLPDLLSHGQLVTSGNAVRLFAPHYKHKGQDDGDGRQQHYHAGTDCIQNQSTDKCAHSSGTDSNNHDLHVRKAPIGDMLFVNTLSVTNRATRSERAMMLRMESTERASKSIR